jgi:acetolactate synthase-1/2/3 large subunit
MLGMHGTLEANMAMHDCDLMIAIGSRFDDRVTGRLDAFSPESKKIHIDIDPSSINKNIPVDLPIVADAGLAVDALLKRWWARGQKADRQKLSPWWAEIYAWQARQSLRYKHDSQVIKPQYAIQRLYELTKDRETFITTEVGQHQMWAAQHYKFDKPKHWMTSGGLGTMGYGFPSAMGVQVANPDALVVCIAGEASWVMNMQEMSTLVQHRLPVKSFILNNSYMGMVRQWQELFHGNRYSESYMDSLPDFVKLAEAFGAVGLRASKPDELDGLIEEMIRSDKPVIADVVVDRAENVYPMIPSGAAHNEIQLGPNAGEDVISSEDGMALV